MADTVNVIRRSNVAALKVDIQAILDNGGQILYIYPEPSPAGTKHVVWYKEADEPEA